jgi:SAM-dependent methyltransferase
MSAAAPVTIDGIKCYSPSVAEGYEDYPEGGFDLTAQAVETSFWVRSRNRIFGHLVRANRAKASVTRFFEIGCGTGDFIRTLAGDPSLAITGSEVYVKGLRYAKASVPNVEFVQLDIARDRIDAAFDLVAAFDVIEHVDDDASAIAHMARMLADSGTLILSVPQYPFMWSSIDDIVKHKRRYSRRELVGKVEKSGLKVTFCTSFVCLLFPAMLVSRLLDRKRDVTETDHAALEKRVAMPAALNRVFDLAMRIDEALIRRGVSLPFGGTLIVVAKKNGAGESCL